MQQLKLKLQILPDVREDHLKLLRETLFKEERYYTKIKKELLSVYRNVNSTCQI